EADGLGQSGTLVVIGMIRVDDVLHLLDVPDEILLDHRALNDLVALALETALPPWRAHRFKVAALVGRRRAARAQQGGSRDGAVAVGALNLDRRPHLAVELRVAVHVLDEVAIDAVHPLFEMDVHKVNWNALATRRGLRLRAMLFLDELRHL